MFQAILEKVLSGCDRALGAVVMGFDGIAVQTVVRDEAFDVRTLATEFSFVLGQVRKAADLLELGEVEEVTIRAERATLVVRVLSPEYFVAVVLAPEANAGKARFRARLALPDLRAQL